MLLNLFRHKLTTLSRNNPSLRSPLIVEVFIKLFYRKFLARDSPKVIILSPSVPPSFMISMFESPSLSFFLFFLFLSRSTRTFFALYTLNDERIHEREVHFAWKQCLKTTDSFVTVITLFRLQRGKPLSERETLPLCSRLLTLRPRES